MFRNAALRSLDTSEIGFSLLAVTDSIQPTRVELKAVCGPGDQGEPVLTIMLPEED